MRIVVKVPGEAPEVREVEDVSLSVLQDIVGGWIELVPIRDAMPRQTTLFCNEEGKFDSKFRPNIAIPGDVVVGSVVATGEDEKGETCGLTEPEAAAICRLLTTLSSREKVRREMAKSKNGNGKLVVGALGKLRERHAKEERAPSEIVAEESRSTRRRLWRGRRARAAGELSGGVGGLDMTTVVILHGSHDSYGEGACAMELVDYLDRRRRGVHVDKADRLTDSPACTCPVIAAFVRRWNDAIINDEDRTRLLAPMLPLLLDTASTFDVERRRAWMIVDWLAREQMAAWLELATLDEHAGAVRALPELTDRESAEAAMPVILRAREASVAASVAASDAASDAARDAARDAAWGTAWRAASDAVRWRAASDAVRDAASDAAWGTAWMATRDAARDATRDAARDAVRDAVRDVAWGAASDAARGAAWGALRPTVQKLQTGAQDLIRRFCCEAGVDS